MKNIFSPKLYLQGLRKVRTLGIAMSIVMIALNAWIPLMCMTESRLNQPVQAIHAGQFAPFGLLLLIFAPLLVYNMFSYLNERRSSDFFHALPQKRICVYVSFTAAIFTWIASVLLLSTAVNSVLWAAAKYYTVSADVIVLTTLGFFIMALVLAGFMALAMMLTGTAVANCLVFLLFFLFVRAFGVFFLYGLQSLAPMFNPLHSLLRIFDWDFFLPIALLAQVTDGGSVYGAFGHAGMVLYWFAVAVLLWAGSAVAYCKRKSESATKSAPNKIMQNIYRIGVTFPFLMLGAFLFIVEKDFYICVLCVVVAFLVWVIFELLTTKKIKNVLRSLPLLLIPVLMTAGFAVSLRTARYFVYHNTPEREQIVGAKIEISGANKDYVNAILSLTETSDEETLDRIFEAITCTKESENWTWNERNQKGYIYSETVTLRLRSGRKITYNLRSNSDLYKLFREAQDIREQLLALVLNDENIDRVYGTDFPESYYPKLWEALQEDFRALPQSERLAYLNSRKSYENAMSVYANGSYQGISFTQEYFIHPVYTPNATRLCLEYYALSGVGTLEKFAAVRDEILQYTPDDVEFVSLDIDSYLYEKKWNAYSTDFEVVQDFLRELSADAHLTDYQNAKNVYFVRLSTEAGISEDKKRYDYYEFYLTLSEEDLRLYEEVWTRHATKDSQ